MSLIKNIKEKSDSELENIMVVLQKKLISSNSVINLEARNNIQLYINELNNEIKERQLLNNQKNNNNDYIETDPGMKDVPFVPPSRIISTF